MSSIEPPRKPESRLPVAPQMAWRVAILGTIALVMFGIIFFRLWYLQVLTGNHYVALASAQKHRPVSIAAPRGGILASNGTTLVSSMTKSAVEIVPSKLPESLEAQITAYKRELEVSAKRAAPLELEKKAVEARLSALKSSSDTPAQRQRLRRQDGTELKQVQRSLKEADDVTIPGLPASMTRDRALYRRLGRLLKISPRKIDELVIRNVDITPYAPVSIDSNVGFGPSTLLAERKSEFPGVEQGPIAVRSYPHGEMAAQIFGHVGPVTKEELEGEAFKGVPEGTTVGQSGLEYQYDRDLRGEPGKREVQVNADGEPIDSTAKEEVQPKPGYDLQTTIDLPLQIEAEKALHEELAAAKQRGSPADGAGFLAMDPVNGEILAAGSYPSYNPGFFTKPFTEAEYKALNAPPTLGVTGGDALLDRTVEGGYATGSTFKPVTAMAGLEAGIITPEEEFGGGSCLEVSGEKFCNDQDEDDGNLDLVHALEVSLDTYFFTVGERAYDHGGNIIQKMAHKLGIGDPTGIDLPSEFPGVVPDAKYIEELNKKEERCTREEHGKPCGYIFEPGEVWSVGDDMHLALGQGELLTDPLQMAVVYSTLVNAYKHGGHGWRPRPHFGKQIDNANRELVRTLKFPPEKTGIDLNESDLGYVFEGIHDATVGPGGTSTTVWKGWNESLHETYGKTGTAERQEQHEQAWYMVYIESEKRPLVIAVTVEQGGYGAETAAPIARLIADQYYGQPKQLVVGSTVPEN